MPALYASSLQVRRQLPKVVPVRKVAAMIRYLALMLLALSLFRGSAQSSDDQYLSIYSLIQQADLLARGGQISQALAKYTEAQTALQEFKRRYPQWNEVVVDFRLSYLAEKVGAPPATNAVVPGTTAPISRPPASLPRSIPPPVTQPAEPESELSRMQGVIQGLQSEKASLEARLKEALAAQPAVSDPRELARAEDKIRSLQKDNELLKSSLSQEKSKSPAAVSANSLEQAQRALADTKGQLAEQSRRAEALALEKQALQKKLDSLIPSPWNTNTIEKTRKDLDEANRHLAEQTETASRLKLEKEALAAKLKAIESDPATTASLRAENQSLKKQLADLNTFRPPSVATNAAKARAAEAPARIAELETENQNLRLEKALLETRLAQAPVPAAPKTSAKGPSPSSPTPAQTADSVRIKQLEKERDDYQKKLDAAIKEIYGRKGKATTARIEAAENQVALLRARLEIYEARQVPYTDEELALFRKPEIKIAAADSKVARKPVSELPPGTVKLVAEAQRYFSTHQLDKAEEKYIEVVKQDNKNATSLANLAVIQMEMNRLAEAEKNIVAAVAAAPDDAYALAILGQLRFRQARYDDALDALSRAAKLDPKSAQVQNFLGITLGEKGLRGPAETALRKAIQLDPTYGEAHHNLAVIYLTQNPPLVELARWHYQKALAAGNPPNTDIEKMLAAKKPSEATP
jgi:uncharacterized protein HemY